MFANAEIEFRKLQPFLHQTLEHDNNGDAKENKERWGKLRVKFFHKKRKNMKKTQIT